MQKVRQEERTMALIYAVEDDKNILEIEMFALKNSGYQVEGFECARDFYKKLEEKQPDLALLDIMLPDEEGLEIVAKLRRRPETKKLPIIMVTAKSTEIDKVKGLDVGADDYLTKPFRLAELRARVAAHLRRQNRAPASRMVRGGIGFDLAAKTAMVGEQPLPFTRSEYAISEYLALHAGQTFSKEQIYEAVFGYDGTADDTAVTQHIKNIRAKLRTAGVAAPETVLKTIWGVGYQWKSET